MFFCILNTENTCAYINGESRATICTVKYIYVYIGCPVNYIYAPPITVRSKVVAVLLVVALITCAGPQRVRACVRLCDFLSDVHLY